ncbi:hypothetical protein ACWC0C_47230 [Streptomyces sp. NPDC001709]
MRAADPSDSIIERGDLSLTGLHAQCTADGLDEAGHGAADVGEVDGVAVLGVDTLAQNPHRPRRGLLHDCAVAGDLVGELAEDALAVKN